MRWLTDGDRNTKFLHAYVIGRRRKLQVEEILTAQGDRITTTQILTTQGNFIRVEALSVFVEQFAEPHEVEDF